MKKYTADEWIDLLVGAVDFEEALAEVVICSQRGPNCTKNYLP